MNKLLGTIALLSAVGVPAALVCRAEEKKLERMPLPGEALPGRPAPMPLDKDAITGGALDAQPAGTEVVYFGMGCFWGAEEHFFHLPGVVATSVGYGGGETPNPNYEEVCTGRTGAAEVTRVVYDPSKISFQKLLAVFWEQHDPTEGYRQGNDEGTQYRSVIFTTTDEQTREATASRDAYAAALKKAHQGRITTEIRQDASFYYAEGYHQQYCFKNPEGYCGHTGLGIKYPQ